MTKELKILSFRYEDITIDFIERLKKPNNCFECDADRNEVDFIISAEKEEKIESTSNL